uniref:Ras-related protein Rab-1 n=1 Tax=Leptocylindrus danicus TaxID=163516 RepID=A0A7S2LD57_9STRA|mmetsp:Transcript_3540/g.5136  ORF Transcript_3540/g.5136 Transcript_3540/m.5136 type:complete len:212 (+) Transcript_3540:165-800(+)
MTSVHVVNYDMQIKLLTIGDSGVGKTSLILRYIRDSYSPTFISTMGIDYKVKVIDMEDDQRIKLQIWDTAGQERFRTITKSYYRGSHGILLVYDATDRQSFDSICSWMSQITEHADVDVNTVLVGNKCDLLDRKAVSSEEGANLAKEYNMEFFETSAKNDINVEECVLCLVKSVNDRLVKDGVGRPPAGANVSRAFKATEIERKKTANGCC